MKCRGRRGGSHALSCLILHKPGMVHVKDGAYYCYCAYVLRISRYSNFLSVMLTNTGIFLRSLNYPEKVDKSK